MYLTTVNLKKRSPLQSSYGHFRKVHLNFINIDCLLSRTFLDQKVDIVQIDLFDKQLKNLVSQ